jgi:DNA-directed RNA polymerase subunit omega
MLVKPPLEKLLPKVENRYTLAILVAKRARQLVDGAMPLMHSDSPNFVTVACEELGSNRVSCVKGILSPYIPLRPEIEAARLAARTAAEQANLADAVKDAFDQAAFAADALDESDVGLIAEALLNLPDQEENEIVEDDGSDSADDGDEDAPELALEPDEEERT